MKRKMTTKASVLDSHKLHYEDMPLKKPKVYTARYTFNKAALKPKQKRPSLIKAYFKYLVEVILA